MNADMLQAGVLYLTPSNRLCQLVPQAGRLADWTFYEFQYVDRDGQVQPGTFTLRRNNVHILREAKR